MYHTNKTIKQVEDSLSSLIKKYRIQEKITVDEIKKWIWNASGHAMEAVNQYHKKCFQLFPEPKDIDEMNDIMQVFTDAWNFFPHKELAGKAPNDLFQEAIKKSPKSQAKSRKMPKIIVGGREMEWDEYERMLREMEKAQKPFKKWIESDALPKYKKYLEQMVENKRAREEHYNVADIFFERALHIGFVTFEEIRPDFIQQEFPHWWPTHVMYSNLEPYQVRESLKKFFTFAELVYGINMNRYGF
ncbi:hypothetical protein HZA39_02690 [Candidatus Peregrinibacteria bacterium]|nr:hypothetical protein [Candidatus Peregrinibacteria bacterium]